MSIYSKPVVACSCAEGWRPEDQPFCSECREGVRYRLRRLADGCRTKADLYAQAHPEIPASFRIVAVEIDHILKLV